MPLRGPNTYGDLITQLADLKNPMGNITDTSSLQKTFDINPNLTGSIFGARKRALMGNKARSLSSASARMSGRVANPEAIFSGVEGDYANAFGNLEASQGQAELGQQQYLTQLLYSILQGNNQFEFQRQGMQSQALGGQLQEKQYEENKPGPLDDLLAVLGGAGKFLGTGIGGGQTLLGGGIDLIGKWLTPKKPVTT